MNDILSENSLSCIIFREYDIIKTEHVEEEEEEKYDIIKTEHSEEEDDHEISPAEQDEDQEMTAGDGENNIEDTVTEWDILDVKLKTEETERGKDSIYICEVCRKDKRDYNTLGSHRSHVHKLPFRQERLGPLVGLVCSVNKISHSCVCREKYPLMISIRNLGLKKPANWSTYVRCVKETARTSTI